MDGQRLQRCAADRAEELPGAELTHPFGEGWDVFKVRGKVFMLHTVLAGESIVILKADPEDARILREGNADISPGYHMNKTHWITLHPGGELDAGMVEDLVTESYLQVLEHNVPRSAWPVDPAMFDGRSTVVTDGATLQRAALGIARSLPGIEEGYPFTPALLVCKVRGRVFLIVTEDPAERIITVKAEPPHVDGLVSTYPSARPGRYLDKRHWVSIGTGAGITQGLVEDLVRDSYDLAVERLPRHERDQLTAGGAT